MTHLPRAQRDLVGHSIRDIRQALVMRLDRTVKESPFALAMPDSDSAEARAPLEDLTDIRW